MDRGEVLAAFDAQMRVGAAAEGPGARVERVGGVVRNVAADPDGWSAVVWSDLDERTANAAIAEQVGYFGALGQSFEWKHYAHDHPVDLPARLIAAGLVPEPEEALMVAEVATLDTDAVPPPGVRLVPITDPAGVALLVRVHEEVFGEDHAALGRTMVAQLATEPKAMASVLAMAGDRAVCSARVSFHHGTEFASLWGGGTLPEWRGRGIYRALVAYRARLAREHGFRYLQVDALPPSRPILERLGFVRLTTTTPYVWRPREAA